MVSAPGRSGARRPEKRVTARSKLPQKKCTGLALPMNPERNLWKTASTERRMRQKVPLKIGNGDGTKRQPPHQPVTALEDQPMRHKVESQLERSCAVRNV